MDGFHNFTDQVVVITGASRGLGEAMAIAFASQGARVVVSSRKQEACEAVVHRIAEAGGQAVAIPCHVGDWDALPAFVDAVVQQLGGIDVLINNAGIAPTAESSADISEALFDKIIDVNLKGPFRLSTLALPHLQARRGAIINITSLAAVKPDPAYPVYAAAKGALNIITRSQAMEFGPDVRVNAIMAGPFWTDIAKSWREAYEREASSAMRRMGRPEEIVSAAFYLASRRSSYTTGSVLQVDGGIL